MKAECPECGRHFTVEDFVEPGQKSTCPECGASFDTEAHLQDEMYNAEEQQSYVVDWQLQ